MLRSPVASVFPGEMSGARDELGASGASDMFRYGSTPSSSSWKDDDFGSASSSSTRREPARPKYLWEHIPPRLAPEAGDEDLLQLPADDDDFDVDVDYDPAPTSSLWGCPPARKSEDHHLENPVTSRLSVSINTGCGSDAERRPLHHSGGVLASSGTSQQIDIGLPAPDSRSHIQLEITGCPTSLKVSVTTKRDLTPATSRSGLARGCVDSTRISSRRSVESLPAPGASVEAPQPVEDDQKVLTRALGYLKESGWYYGALSSQQAQLRLQGTPEGTFLARDSLHNKFVFALSVQTAHGPTSVRIQLVKGRFRLDAPADLQMPTFGDVNALVEHYARSGPVTVDGLPLLKMRLGKPLLRQAPTLQHLCRLALNRVSRDGSCSGSGSSGGSRSSLERRLTNLLPAPMEQYMDQYPYAR